MNVEGNDRYYLFTPLIKLRGTGSKLNDAISLVVRDTSCRKGTTQLTSQLLY